MQDNATEVTAAGIARLAGVGRAAVSNWRRRHVDFPKPVGGTETSPSFALAAVEAWLRKQGKLAEVPLRERVWQQLVGHPEGPLTALVHTGCVLLLIHERPTVWLDASAGSDERLAAMLPGALERVLTSRFGGTSGRGGRDGVRADADAGAGSTVNPAGGDRGVNTFGGAQGVNTSRSARGVNTGSTAAGVNVAPATPGVNSALTPPSVNTEPKPAAVNPSQPQHPVNTPPVVHSPPTLHALSLIH
ncbi:restriction endonuclease subunit M, partial [Streptomyces sp. MMG1121]